MDDDLGLVMDRLDELGLAEDTILIYTSDHGGMTGIDGVGYACAAKRAADGAIANETVSMFLAVAFRKPQSEPFPLP